MAIGQEERVPSNRHLCSWCTYTPGTRYYCPEIERRYDMNSALVEYRRSTDADDVGMEYRREVGQRGFAKGKRRLEEPSEGCYEEPSRRKKSSKFCWFRIDETT